MIIAKLFITMVISFYNSHCNCSELKLKSLSGYMTLGAELGLKPQFQLMSKPSVVDPMDQSSVLF